ncbi:Lrp/AsnC family transcriptional regulator [Oceaniglobus trochenteri]|uniref:Lrp/AsnC family transcriptional regulator n=1 Tax=Oceaniglobus trochenteri TaxID=2763260 RepID=UPI001CFFF179|nr:Lrp/AsnC family transcriptional regulator [Oceaniglobus trochenteri]
MDDTDTALLAALRRDARTPLAELAKQLGRSRATLRARIERMQADGTIRGFTVLTREDVARSPVRGLMMLGIEGAGTSRLIHRLQGFVPVRAVHSTNGKWDLIVELGAATLEELDQTLFAIRELPGITSSETNLLLSTRAG